LNLRLIYLFKSLAQNDVVIPSGAGQFFLPSSFRRRSWSAQSRNLLRLSRLLPAVAS